MIALRVAAAMLTLGAVARAEIPPAERRSGFETMSPALQAMQRDDASNPAMLAVREGEIAWGTPPATGKPACSGCHGQAEETMRGVSARHPVFDAASGAPVDLAGRIRQCQGEKQGITPAARESAGLIALEAYIALQSRGMPIPSPADTRLAPALEAGKALFFQRFGQLNLSCAQCHDDNWGRSLGGSRIPQGHATGYPIFRLEWQAMGSLQRRLRTCLTGVRAEPFAPGAAEWIALELYLKARAAGMASDAPALRP